VVPTPAYVIFLNGTYGMGKSTVLDHVGDLLAARGTAFSLMDVDWFHRSWPPAADDPRNVLTEAENMAAVWGNYLRAGPRQLVVAGVLTSGRDRERYQETFALPVRSVRLVASAASTEARLRRRYSEQQSSSLAWHLERHSDLADRLAAHDLDELVIDTEAGVPHGVAVSVLGHFGLS
jgi:hypothetical protein